MIETLRLQRFKNFHDATLTLGPLTVLVGTNASGKSNLRDAFRFVHGMSRGYALAEIIGEKYVEGGVLQWKGIRGGAREVALSGETSFSITTNMSWRLGGHQHSIAVEVGDARVGPRVVAERLSGIYDSHPSFEPPDQEGVPYLFVRLPTDEDNRRRGKRLRFLDNQPVLTQFSEHQDAKKRYRDVAAQYVAGLESMRFLDLAPEAMKTPSYPGQVILGDRGENLSSVMLAICETAQTRLAVAEWIRELTPLDVVDFDFPTDQTGRVLLTLVESDGRRTSAYSASDGTLRFLAIIAALLGPDPARFYFLEEIDNGIHPTRLYLLLQLIEQCTKEGKTQVVATTHSPQLLAMLSADSREHASLVYRLDDSPFGHVRRILDIPNAREVLERQNLSRLHESGWLEDAVAFSEPEEAAG